MGTFAEKLSEKMMEKGLKNSEVAFECSCSPWLVSQWRNGHSVPDGERLGVLAEYLGCDVKELASAQTEDAQHKAVEENDFKRNGSGYYDPTAYKAMKNVDKEERKVEMRSGEIWEVENANGKDLAVVISVNASLCNVLILKDEKIKEDDVAVAARGMKYTNPAFFTYRLNRGFVSFVRTMGSVEFDQLKKKIVKACGLSDLAECEAPTPDNPVSIETQHYIETMEARLKNTEIEVDKLRAEKEILKIQNEALAAANEMTVDTRIEMAKTEAQRDLYKKLFEDAYKRITER